MGDGRRPRSGPDKGGGRVWAWDPDGPHPSPHPQGLGIGRAPWMVTQKPGRQQLLPGAAHTEPHCFPQESGPRAAASEASLWILSAHRLPALLQRPTPSARSKVAHTLVAVISCPPDLKEGNGEGVSKPRFTIRLPLSTRASQGFKAQRTTDPRVAGFLESKKGRLRTAPFNSQ